MDGRLRVGRGLRAKAGLRGRRVAAAGGRSSEARLQESPRRRLRRPSARAVRRSRRGDRGRDDDLRRRPVERWHRASGRRGGLRDLSRGGDRPSRHGGAGGGPDGRGSRRARSPRPAATAPPGAMQGPSWSDARPPWRPRVPSSAGSARPTAESRRSPCSGRGERCCSEASRAPPTSRWASRGRRSPLPSPCSQ